VVEAKLAAARVATLFRFARQVYIGGAAAGALLVLALWKAFPVHLLVVWFCTLLGGMLVRFRVQASFARAADRVGRALVWERHFAIATLAIGAVWAFVPAALFPEAPDPLQMVVLVVVSGVVMAGAGLYAASPRTVHAFVLPPMAAMVAVLVLQESEPHRMLAAAMVIFTFVTLRVAKEIRRSLVDALRARLEQEALLDTLPVGVAFVARREIVRCNRRLEQMLGYEPGELTGKSTRAWFRSDERWQEAAEQAYARMAAGAIMEGDARLQRKDGTRFWCRVLARAIDASAPRELAIFTFADVDRRVAAENALRESEERLRLAVDAAGLVYWEWDRESGMISAAGALNPWSEYRDRVHPDDRERYLAAVEAAWKQDAPYAAEYRVLGADGRVQWISARGKVLRDASGRRRRMIGVAQDISERRQQDETVRFLAYHDALTGLPNRRLLEDRLQQALYRAQRSESRLAVLLIDLDDFKQVNDSAGHRAGDAVLREVALRLASCMRKADTLARHGGDEFVVVMGDIAGEAECQAVAEKILRALAPEVRVDGRAFTLGASIGIAVYPGGSGDADALLRHADAAMYRAKQLGRNHYRFHGGAAV
jgi:diguanylate cyclase (GGDEF)-like protein/PAS domain S-box-containing protein